MNKKTVILAAVALILAVLTIYDYSTEENGDELSGNDYQQENNFERILSVVNSEQEILSAYGDIAIPYALEMAEAQTFFIENISPKQAAKRLFEQLSSQHGMKIKALNIGEPQLMAEGVYSISSSVKFDTSSHRALFRILSAMSNSNNGMTWRSFEIKASVEEKNITLMGDVMMVFIKAIE
ncbi:hypothetical protein [Methylomarinum vadi]|uniref:hypothetical protein n=1 Tax=Methylomarinum vadi TaxID=438855 RepID=UPI0004DF1226|nr:hypothetical protein [Methylomarinum vadi]